MPHLQDILLADSSCLDELSKNQQIPIDLIESLDATELVRFIKNDKSSDSFNYKYAGIEHSYLEQNSSTNGAVNTIQDQCLSMFADRHIVLLEKIRCGEVQKVIELQKSYVGKIHSLNSRSQKWTLVLILESDLTDDDREALERSQIKDRDNPVRPRIYLLGPNLDVNTEGVPINGINIWSHAVPPLLSRLRADHPRHQGIWAWRSMVLTPEVPNLNLVREYKSSIEEHLFLGGGETAPGIQTLQVPQLRDPMLKDFSDELQELDKEVEDKKGESRIKTIHSLILESWMPRSIIKKTKKLITTIGLREVGVAKSNVAKLHDRTIEDSQGVLQQERQLWKTIDDNPQYLSGASENIAVEMAGLNEKITNDADPWKQLIANLHRADAIKRAAEEAAIILETARAYYIAFNVRLLLAFVSILVVFYITFVVLYPVMSFFGLDALSFWISSAMGVSGVVSAMFFTLITERNALKNGAKKVDIKIESARKQNKATHAFIYMISSAKNIRRSSWIHSLNKIKKNISRLSRSVRDATYKITVNRTTEASDEGTGLAAIQKEAYFNNLYLWASLHLRMTEDDREAIKEYIAKLKKDLGEELKSSWKKLSVCDSEKNGYYPVDYVRKTWGSAIKLHLYKFEKKLTEKFVDLLESSSMISNEVVRESIKNSNGFSEDVYPFMSVPIIKNINGVVYYYFKSDPLFHQVKKSYSTESDSERTNNYSKECSYFGLVVEEIELELSNQKVGDSH
jgi:hypothetical protein